MKKQGKHFTTLLLCYHSGPRPTFIFFSFLMWFDPPTLTKKTYHFSSNFLQPIFLPNINFSWRLLGTEIWKLPFSFCLWVEFPVCQEDGADLSLQSFWGGIAPPRSPPSIYCWSCHLVNSDQQVLRRCVCSCFCDFFSLLQFQVIPTRLQIHSTTRPKITSKENIFSWFSLGFSVPPPLWQIQSVLRI